MISIAIADDHTLFADGLAEALGSLPDITVRAVARDGASLLEAIKDAVPDVLLIDLEMPGIDGLHTLELTHGRIPTIVVTMHADDEHRAQVVAAGAAGFLSKSAPLSDLAAAIRAAHGGVRFLDATTLRSVLDQYREPVLDPGAALLTAREREILALLGQGVTTTDELATRLFISPKTVKNHLASIFDKLSIEDRAQAAVEAIRLGFAPRGSK
jgi:DNA-binding NarL/FixJ family response regulator